MVPLSAVSNSIHPDAIPLAEGGVVENHGVLNHLYVGGQSGNIGQVCEG